MATRALFAIIFFFSLMMSDLCYGQNNPDKIFQFRIAPLNLVDPVTGTIQAGIQKRFSSRIAVAFDYGLKFDKLSLDNKRDVRKNYEYHKYKAEVKYFFTFKALGSAQTEHTYLSVQGFYFPQQYRKDNDWLIKNGRTYHYDYSHINRKAVAASLILGDESISGRFVFDGYFGLGIKRLSIKHQPTNAVEGTRSWLSHLFVIDPIDLYEGKFYRIHILVGLKIGYIINK